MRVKQFLWWVFLLTLASMATGCLAAGSLSASAVSSIVALPASAPLPQAIQSNSGIYLTATIGPTCVSATRDSPACVQPYMGEFVVTALNAAEVTRVMTNYQGQATVTLPPGKYIVGLRTEDVESWTAPMFVDVPANRYASVSFTIDSGLHWQTVSTR